MADRRWALHASMLSMLARCGYQFYLRYIKGLREPPGVAMLTGTAGHRAADANLKHRLATGAPLPEEAVLQIAADQFDAAVAEQGVRLTDAEQDEGPLWVKGRAKDMAVRVARAHYRLLAPKLKPIAVERKMRLVLEGFPFDVECTIDVQEEGTIRDLKNVARAPRGDEARSHPQLHLYTLVRNAIDQAETEKVVLDHIVKAASGPYSVPVAAPAPRNFDHVLARLEAAARVVEAGNYYPTDPTGPSGWVCSEKHCGYWQSICPHGRRATVQVPGVTL